MYEWGSHGRLQDACGWVAVRLTWLEADRLMTRLEDEGIIKESVDGPLQYEVVWENVPKGPNLA